MMRQLRAVVGSPKVYLVSEAASLEGWRFEPISSADLWVAIHISRPERIPPTQVGEIIELADLWLERHSHTMLALPSEAWLQRLVTCLQEASGWPCALLGEDPGRLVAASPGWTALSDDAKLEAVEGPELSWQGAVLRVAFVVDTKDLESVRLEAAKQIVRVWANSSSEGATSLPWRAASAVGPALGSLGNSDYRGALLTAARTALDVLGLDAVVVASRASHGVEVEVSVGRIASSLCRSLADGLEAGWWYGPALLQGIELEGAHYAVQTRPLMAGGRSLGLLAIARRRGPLARKHLEVLRAFEALLSLLMLSRLLEEELRQRLSELDLLWEATSRLVQLTASEETLADLAHTWKDLGRADFVAVFLPSDDSRLIPRVVRGIGSNFRIEPMSVSEVETLVRGAMVVSYRRGAGRSFSLPGNLADLAQGHHLALFYLKVDVPVAAVLLARTSAPFTGRELRLLAIVFRQVSMALRNAQLFHSADHERALLRTLFDQASDGIMLVDNHLRVIGFNRAMEGITGWKAEELLGRECREFMACRDLSGGLMCANGCPALEAIWNHGQLPYVELKALDRNGQPKDLAVSFSYVPSPFSPDVSYSLAIVRDVTAAKAADRVRNQLVSAVSHELRTPLAALKASVSLLRAALPAEIAEGSGPVVRLVDNAERAVDRLTRIVEDSLDLARAQAGRLAVKREPVEMAQLIDGVVTALQPLAVSRGQTIAVVGPVGPVWLKGDRGRLEQVLTNLLSNALKYSPEGTQVDVALQTRNSTICVEISDRGPGVPVGEQAAIFEPFYRGERAARDSVGSGLGLAVARSLVELHGGRILVRNRQGGGATFTVELPVAPDARAEPTLSASDHESAAGRR
jgi:PAS domain S-box-containing protein